MSIRSKLLATVAVPVLSASILAQPVLADTLTAPILLAQENGDQPSDEQLLQQREAEEQQKAAEEEARRAEEQQRAADEENRRQAEEQQQKAAQEEAQRQAEEQKRAAEAEAQRQAEEQQKAAEREAEKQAEEQQKAAEREAQKQAEEQARQADEQKKAEEEAQRQSEQQQQKAAEEEAQRRAEEQKKAEEEAARKVAEPQEQPAPAEEPVKEAPAPQAEKPSQSPAEASPATPQQKEPAEESIVEHPEEVPPQEPKATEAPQNEAQPAQPVEQPQSTDGQQKPAPEIVDQRSTEEKQEIAKDPAQTDDTVVLPVENGAAILDSDKDADNSGGSQSREERRKQREQQRSAEENAPPPANDAAAQVAIPEEVKAALPQKIEANLKEEGTRIKEAPVFAVPETTNIVNNTVVNNTVINNTTVNNVTNNVTNVKVIEEVDNRVILDVGDRIFVRGDDRPRLRRDAEQTYYDELPRGRTRETIVRPGGNQIVTIYDRYGDILQRSRIDRDGNEYLMIYAPEYDDNPRASIIDVGYELPPMRLTIPVRDYIIDVADDPDRDFYDFLAMPPVERVERVYTIDEVRHSARLRDKVRRIDLDTIHFATGSAEVSMSQAKTLRKVATAMQKVLAKDPGETFFIEGHTDAVGSDRSNLVLSDKRAESVASLLTEVYDIPAENLVTQGYGERFLKIRTQAAEQENRRVTIRRVTPLVRPVAKR
ncbi:OmpA family protein [Brucella intermedia]|uniref:OmpA family protein n=1 Tax=Brucella intermedia TaxID=94625 RepID=UPI00124E6465|nr:OmpA family protein [Brucella intermedia]KAB2723652.1 OmpA family protein [Brucella intermedia]